MKAFFHPTQDLHIPRSYLSRGQMRTPLEIPDRTAQILKGLEQLNYSVEKPTDHGMRAISKVHDLSYLTYLESAHRRWKASEEDWGDEVMSNIYVRERNPRRGLLAETAYYLADGSCPIGPDTWDAAYWSAQSALSATDAILRGDRNAYAVCRPPGHHARRDAAGGFCYLNNAAIAAEVLAERYPRVAILDTDMHHGQGVQEIFYDRSDVLYVSIHGDPTNFYPVVAGFEEERGTGAGLGYNVNLPMPHGSSEDTFFDRLEEAAAVLRMYQPDVVILTLGFDIYKEDPQAKVAVTSRGFNRLGARVAALGMPVLVLQEGGYHLDTLAENTRQFFTGLEQD